MLIGSLNMVKYLRKTCMVYHLLFGNSAVREEQSQSGPFPLSFIASVHSRHTADSTNTKKQKRNKFIAEIKTLNRAVSSFHKSFYLLFTVLTNAKSTDGFILVSLNYKMFKTGGEAECPPPSLSSFTLFTA